MDVDFSFYYAFVGTIMCITLQGSMVQSYPHENYIVHAYFVHMLSTDFIVSTVFS